MIYLSSVLSIRYARQLPFIVLLSLGLCISNAHADGDFLVFTQIDVFKTFSDSDPIDNDDSEVIPSFDLFVTRQYKSIQFLGEFILSEAEQELERFQFSWSAGHGVKVWLGRYHNPIGYWNTEYHHGTYLQPSIQRPWITQFEDDDGVLPTHVSGLLVEGSFLPEGDSEYQYMLSIGYGPELESQNNLEPVNILDPGAGNHKPSVTINLSYVADSLAKKQVGVFANVSKIPSADPSIREIEQSIFGIFSKWYWGRYDLITSIFNVNDDAELVNAPVSKKQSGSFNAAYMQLSYKYSTDWILYGRYENIDDNNDPYLNHRPQYLQNRGLLGVRLEFESKQSSRLEFSRDTFNTRTFNRLILQWNAVFS